MTKAAVFDGNLNLLRPKSPQINRLKHHRLLRRLRDPRSLQAAVGPDAMHDRQPIAYLVGSNLPDPALLVEGAGRDLGRMRIHGDGRKALVSRNLAQMGAETLFVDGEIIVETIFDSVIRALQGGDKIEIRGFGSFRIRQRNPRIGRNPKTGERVEVPAKRVPYFKPSKELRDLVNPEEAVKPS